MVLAVISGLTTAAVAGSSPAGTGWMSALVIVAKASLFLALAVVVGRFWSQRVFSYAARLQVSGALLAICICFCFVVATLAGIVGLAPIVGAFAAGIVLEEVHYRPFLERGERTVQELLFPLTTLVVPVFFVLMGFHVDLRSFSSVPVLIFAGLITVAAVLGKQICGLAARGRSQSFQAARRDCVTGILSK